MDLEEKPLFVQAKAVGLDKFILEIEDLINSARSTTADTRLLVQVNGKNYSTIENDVNINSWEIEDHRGHKVLVINRENLNEGQRIDLDLTATLKNTPEELFIHHNKDDNSSSLQVGDIGIWVSWPEDC